MRFFLVLASLAMVLGGLAQPAHAATRYVEGSWGSDGGGNDCRDKKSPCATIGHALGQAAARDRVLVGPGVYTPTSPIMLALPGISLLSVAGSAATIIDGTSISDQFVVGIGGYVEKVALGQKRKGFTIIADDSVSAAIVYVGLSHSVRIEGNRLVGLSDDTESGIVIQQTDNLTIRYNDIQSAHPDPMNYGIRTFIHDFTNEHNEKWTLSDNRIRNVDRCIHIYSTEVNHGNRVSRNRLENCARSGITIDNRLNDNSLGESTRGRYQDNVILMNASASLSYGMFVQGGDPRISKNLVDAREGYASGIWLIGTRRANIRDNVVLGPPPAGGPMGSVNGLSTSLSPPGTDTHNTEMVIQGNTIDRFNYVVAADIREIKTLKSNNLLQANTCPYFTHNVVPPAPLKASRNFWGDPAGPDLSFCASTAAVVSAGNLEFNPASRANPVRFKDPFH